MDLIYSSAQNNPSASAFIERYVKSPGSFNARIYKEDEVYLHGLKHLRNKDLALVLYFKHGAQMMDVVRQIVTWKFGGFNNVSTFLDFACGYGRFTRFLIQELSPGRVWASDIYANAVKYQQNQFGVNGLLSVRDPERLVCNQKFDCIFVASLFSHLPEKRFGSWLKTLHSLLSPGGILVFSVHDEYLLGDIPMPNTGFRFHRKSETKYLSSDEYGTMFVTESFVRSTIYQVLGENQSYCRIRRGLCNHQDIYIVARHANQDFSSLKFRAGPEGHLDTCSLTKTGELRLGGWAGDPMDGVTIVDILVSIGGKIVQRCKPVHHRPDVVHTLRMPKYSQSGWMCSCYLDNARSWLKDILEVKAVSSDGVEALLHLSTLEAALSKRP